MLKLSQLLAMTMSHRPVLRSNASHVQIAFKKPTVGKDFGGYYREIAGTARTTEPGKKNHFFKIRVYWPKNSGYVPQEILNAQAAKALGKKMPPMKAKPAPPFTVDSRVWVSCDCEYFLYHCEVADAEDDSSKVIYSNGKAPIKTNPNHIPHLCKHLISGFRKGALVKK